MVTRPLLATTLLLATAWAASAAAGCGVKARCHPECSERVCGDDGCGGSCGTCDGAAICLHGRCLCTPDCGLKSCGDDGCGGTCGTCPGGFACEGGVCECVPSCAGRACGDDGCWGTCGACPGGGVCVAGACCEPNCSGRECGADGCGGTCGTCPSGYLCGGGECVCQPDCLLRECGGDGCGGSCGLCAADRSCDGGVCLCVPDCAGRACGADGCGGSCGPCRGWEQCWEHTAAGGSQCTAASVTCDGVDPAAASLGLCEAGSDCPGSGECADLCGFATCVCSVDAGCPAEAPVCGLIAPAGQAACLPRCPSGTSDECPPGLGCLLLWRADVAERVCAPPVHTVCDLCGADEDCHLVGDLCWDADGDGIGFCMAACDTDADCLSQFTCVADADSGSAASHCLPVEGGGCF